MLILGTALVAIGLIWMWLVLMNTVDATDLTNWMLLAPLLIAGLGNGFFIAPNVQFIVATVDRQDAGSASAVISAIQRIGSAVGIAIIGSVLFGTLTAGREPRPRGRRRHRIHRRGRPRDDCQRDLRRRRVRAGVRAAAPRPAAARVAPS